MSDWYMVTQLKNFKHGDPRRRPQDIYGPQMAIHRRDARLTSATTSDVVAYINTLK